MNMSGAAEVVGFVGSPRRGGNTEILVDEVLGATAAAGVSTAKVILAQQRIGPCRGCNACRERGACVQHDDMPKLLRLMEDSAVWVLGTPVYWWGPSAQFKLFMDRWYGAGQIVHPEGKGAIVAITLGDTDEATARHTVGMFGDALRYLEIDTLATVIAPGMTDRGDIRGARAVLEAARAAGAAAAARAARSSPALP